jgi:hypothetical protein
MVSQSERDGGGPLADLWFNSHVRRHGSRLPGTEKQLFLRHLTLTLQTYSEVSERTLQNRFIPYSRRFPVPHKRDCRELQYDRCSTIRSVLLNELTSNRNYALLASPIVRI